MAYKLNKMRGRMTSMYQGARRRMSSFRPKNKKSSWIWFALIGVAVLYFVMKPEAFDKLKQKLNLK
jgi:hypothetical protein